MSGGKIVYDNEIGVLKNAEGTNAFEWWVNNFLVEKSGFKRLKINFFII